MKIDTELAEVPFTALPGPKLAWMKLWVADLLTSSFVLSLSELDFARYVKLLMRAWESDTPCFLPNDVVILSRFAGASSLKSFKQSWAIIQSHFTETGDGKYVFNSKERLTFKKQVELNRNSIENGKKNNNYIKNQHSSTNLGIPSAIPSDLPTGIPAPARGLKVLKELQDQNPLVELNSTEELQMIRKMFSHYCTAVSRNPEKYRLTNGRTKKAMQRLHERLALHGGNLGIVEQEFSTAIENLSKSAYHMENGYFDWTDQIFRSEEEFDKRLNWIKPKSNGHSPAPVNPARYLREPML